MSNPFAEVSDLNFVSAFIEAEDRAAELTAQVNAIADIWSRYQRELGRRLGIAGMARVVDAAYATRGAHSQVKMSAEPLHSILDKREPML